MSDKHIPDDESDIATWLRERIKGHAPGYDISIYARPHKWSEVADRIERGQEGGWCTALKSARELLDENVTALIDCHTVGGIQAAEQGEPLEDNAKDEVERYRAVIAQIDALLPAPPQHGDGT